MSGERQLANATGFFFERHGKLFLMTSRDVVLDEASDHRPDWLAIELHTDPANGPRQRYGSSRFSRSPAG
jgi:hypothetical protein